MSGHVARAIVFTDKDDGDSTTQFKDHGSTPTRVRFTGSSETEAGVTAGFKISLAINSDKIGDKHEHDPAGGEAADGEDVSIRRSYVSFGGEFGTINLGHTSEAADGTTYHDKSGVFGIGHGQETGKSTAAAYAPGMGGGRNGGVHFSSASFGPASFALSASQDDRFSAKLSIGGDAGVASYTGSVAYLDTDDGYEEVAGGLGVKLSSGVTWSMAGGTQSNGKEGSFIQSTLGYVFGNNSVGVSWYSSSDVMPEGEMMGDGTAIGIAFLHNMPKAGVDVMASVQQYSADLMDGSEMDDVVAIVGSRVKF